MQPARRPNEALRRASDGGAFATLRVHLSVCDDCSAERPRLVLGYAEAIRGSGVVDPTT
jgi:hypothetical protein